MEYTAQAKAIKVKKSQDSFLRSILRWTRNELFYEFAIKDIETINLKTGKNTLMSLPELKFKVDLHGNFLGRHFSSSG